MRSPHSPACTRVGKIDSRHTVSVAGEALIVEYGLGGDGGLAFAMEPIAPDVFLVEADGARASRIATCSASSGIPREPSWPPS